MVDCAGLEDRYGKSASNDPTESYEFDEKSLACFLALLGRELPDLAELLTAWPILPEAVRAGMIAMVRSSTSLAIRQSMDVESQA